MSSLDKAASVSLLANWSLISLEKPHAVCLFALQCMHLPLPLQFILKQSSHPCGGKPNSVMTAETVDLEPGNTLQGFPGAVNVTATYTLTEQNQLQLLMEATADRTTPINLAQHSYFNLNGEASPANILNHEMYING